MKKFNLPVIAVGFIGALGIMSTANAHLVSFGWTDNNNGSVTLWGEHWHSDQTAASTANGGITISDSTLGSTIAPYKVQWNGVLNNQGRDDMLANGTLTGWALAGNGMVEYRDWLYTDPLVLGNGTWNFFTGTNCCIDTMGNSIDVTLTGITGVGGGTGPGAVVPPTSVAEPATLALLGLGLAGIGFIRHRRKES